MDWQQFASGACIAFFAISLGAVLQTIVIFSFYNVTRK
jgi:hypothetical protein